MSCVLLDVCLLWVVGCWLRVGLMLLVVVVVCGSLFAIWLVFAVRCLVFVACCVLVVCCLVSGVRCSLFVVWCLLFDAWWLLRVV